MAINNLNAGKTPSVQVRVAQSHDAEGITSVINAAFRVAENFFVERDRIDAASVLHFLDSGKFLLAESEGTLLGCVYVEPRQGRAYLGLLAVDPASQHGGLGSLLMNAAEDYCRVVSCRFMDIKIVNLRQELPDYYRKRGYVAIGTSPFPADVETKVPCHFIDMSKSL
ncbi:MAG: GCN5-related N-acetyltransferase [Acidobacteria bacterium]|nr:GCN5-related N-acetyltransferase [Acidobacteriota bacterium]